MGWRKNIALRRHGISLIPFRLNSMVGKSILSPTKEMLRVVGKVRGGDFTRTIQDMTKTVKCDILVSEETVKVLKNSFLMKKEQPQRAKGYSRPITVYKLI